MMVIEDDTDLLELTNRYKRRTLYDKDDKKTRRVCSVQYDEKKIEGKKKKFWVATAVEVVRGVGGWEIPESSYVEVGGIKEIKDSKKICYYVLDVTDPDSHVAFSDVDDMAQAHETREAQRAQRDRDSQVGTSSAGGGSNTRKRARK
jgi:hypothetical protein